MEIYCLDTTDKKYFSFNTFNYKKTFMFIKNESFIPNNDDSPKDTKASYSSR